MKTAAVPRILPWLEATRPKTLTAGLVPVVVGVTLAHAAHAPLRPLLAILTLACAFLIQIGTNFINDALDFQKGTDSEDRVGPRRVTQSGLISANAVMRSGILCFGAAALLSVPLLLQGGWLILGIGLASLLCGYAYTGGPFPLSYLGLGEPFVLVFFGLLAVLGTFFLQTGVLNWQATLAGAQIGLLATVLIAINNLRDAPGDRKARKMTLAVRFGKRFGRAEIAFLCLSPFPLGVLWAKAGMQWAGMLPVLVLPLAFRISHRIARAEPGPTYNGLLAQSALLHLCFGLLLSVGCLFPTG